MRCLLWIVLWLITVNSVNSQTLAPKEKLQQAYSDYFKAERETLFLHFNKNVFFINEPIWFKGYVFDKKNNSPFINTTNVYVGLYDYKGNQLTNKLFFAQNGVFTGSFDNQQELPSGRYYVRAYTNYMNNFTEDESYVSQPIQIINGELRLEPEGISEASNFDLQFLPEGGHMIEDVTNTIGLKIIDCDGNGVEIKGTIINGQNEIVASFKSNEFGLGKFDLITRNNESYKANYTLVGKEYSKQLPNSEPLGFAISVNNYTNENTTYISLKTNEQTLKSEVGKIYYMAIHQNDKASIVEIDLNQLKTTNTIPIKNDKLLPGVNTITLFDNNLNPLIERLIFNYDSKLFLKSTIYPGSKTNDSITINVKTSRKDNSPATANLSVALLPSTSLAYSETEDIIGSFLLQPYLHGKIQNARYYFKDIDREKRYYLDLLLLTQGWSKYKWDDIKTGFQKLTHSFDVGINVEGVINVPQAEIKSYSVQMFSLTNNLNERVRINEDRRFSFKNFYLKDGAQLNLNVYKNGFKADNIKTMIELSGNDKILKSNHEPFTGLCNKIIYNQLDINNVLNGKNQVLDTISLSFKKNEEIDNLERKNDDIGNKYGKGVKVDNDMRKSYATLLDYINSHGFHVSVSPRGGSVVINTKTPKTILANDKPKLIIDDSNMGNNYDMLIGLTLDEIDEIYINPSGMGYGATSGGGIISIYRTKSIRAEVQNNKVAPNELIIKNGFSSEKEFYVPEFYNLSKKDFLLYGTLDWQSNIITDDKGNASFKVPDHKLDSVIAIINGFSPDGKLLSEIIELKLTK